MCVCVCVCVCVCACVCMCVCVCVCVCVCINNCIAGFGLFSHQLCMISVSVFVCAFCILISDFCSS